MSCNDRVREAYEARQILESGSEKPDNQSIKRIIIGFVLTLIFWAIATSMAFWCQNTAPNSALEVMTGGITFGFGTAGLAALFPSIIKLWSYIIN
jgi:hypothetical protein